jgi:hypothetical protein
MLRALALGLGLFGSVAGAETFDWRKLSSQEAMHDAFVSTSNICTGVFGFTLLSPLPKAAMVDKIDAYLLLRDRPDNEVATWAMTIVRPVQAILKDKSDDTLEDDRRAAAAAVAASRDPSTFDEAKARFLESAMAPFRNAMKACEAGTRDPFLGKHYWAGTGSADEQERHFADWFSEFVADLKASSSKPPKRR